MKVRYRPTETLEIEIEGSVKEVFKALAEAGEVFSESACGHCKKESLIYVTREVDGNTFYEVACRNCRHKLSFGQSKDGRAIYPRRRYHKQHPLVKEKKVKEGAWIENNGFEKLVFEKNED